jgi:UPF0716 protein FxsA
MWLFLILVLLPIIEIALFILVGGAIGILPTLALVVLAAVVGTALVRRQGFQALTRLQASIDRGEDPRGQIAHAAMIMLAGVLLIIPGFFTDAIGLLLLVPPVRAFLIRKGASRATVRATTFVRARSGAARPAEVVDVDYEVVDEEQRNRGRSGWTQPH